MSFNPRLLSGLNPGELMEEFKKIDVSPEGMAIMKEKGQFVLVKVDRLSPQAANILKQEMLAKGGEVALGKEHARFQGGRGQAIIMGTRAQYRRLLTVLPRQPFGLPALAKELAAVLEVYNRPPASLTIKGREFVWGKRTYIMGIINVTPDSFSGDGLKKGDNPVDAALKQAERFLEEGADILDIGGESTRPGTAGNSFKTGPAPSGVDAVSEEEEMKRILPVIEKLVKISPLPLSVDTYKATVARAALEVGADMVNDIWGLQRDPEMAAVVARFQAPVIVMHNKTVPGYKDLLGEVAGFLRQSITRAETAGLPREKIIIDPGIGFGKTLEDNLEILARFEEFKTLGRPVLLGTSRKSVIGLTLNLPAMDRMEGTAATVAVGITKGADLIRVHDVKKMAMVAGMTDAVIRRRR